MALSLAACGDDTEPGDADAQNETDSDVEAEAEAEAEADLDADAGGDEGGGTGSLRVLVLGTPLWTDVAEWPPINGAAVALDLPGGGRTEATTDSTGRVEFTGLDWTAGTADVTAWDEGYGLASIVGLDGTDAEVTLVLPNPNDPRADMVDLTVNFVNTSPDAQGCGAGGIDIEWLTDFVPPDYSVVLSVQRGRTFDLAAANFSWTALPTGFDQPWESILLREAGPFDADATIEVDFATAAAVTSVNGSFGLPARTESPLRTAGMWGGVLPSLTPNPGRHFLPAYDMPVGWASHAERPTGGNTMEYAMSWVAPPGVTSPVSEYALVDNSSEGGHLSAALVDGFPVEGAQAFTLLDGPDITNPSSLTTPHPLHGEPFAWELIDTGVTPTLYIRSPSAAVAETILWWITAQTDATTLTVPQPPSGVDVAEVLGTDTLRGKIGILADEPVGARALYAESDAFRIQP
jgi:hypothetical protein